MRQAIDFFKKNGENEDDSLKKLNYAMTSLVIFTIIYVFVLMYVVDEKASSAKQSQEFLKTVVMMPNSKQIGGIVSSNGSNVVLVSTNLLKEPIAIPLDEKSFVSSKEFERGDVVFVKFFDTWGVVIDKSILSGYYKILYRDNIHRLNIVEIPADFILKPSPTVMHPFLFTP